MIDLRIATALDRAQVLVDDRADRVMTCSADDVFRMIAMIASRQPSGKSFRLAARGYIASLIRGVGPSDVEHVEQRDVALCIDALIESGALRMLAPGDPNDHRKTYREPLVMLGGAS
jgi:hypothetical protein